MHRCGRKIRPTVQTLLSLALLADAPAVGQELLLAVDPWEVEVASPGAGYTAQEFGVQDAVVSSVGPWDLQCSDPFELFETGYMSGCNGTTGMQLPSGASIIRFELEACDVESNATTQGLLGRVGPTPTDGATAIAFVQTGFTETPGCGWFGVDVDPPVTVDNNGNSYFVNVGDSEFHPDTRFRSARVIWRRQVSPAPGTATFGDVPTSHLFFRHIEALVDSGITAGCGGGDFCPNDPLTRGQMAAFLATALGLHWAP